MRVTILGAGGIAHAHAQAIQGLARHEGLEDVELTHVVDIDAGRAEEFAAKHSVPHHGTDLQALLDAGAVDVLHVCTPPSLHLAQATAALRAGVHVVVEKPAVLSLAEVDALAAAEQEAADGARFTQIVQHRFGAGALRLRRLLADGTLGRALVATCDTLWYRPPAYFEVPWRGRFDTEGGGPTMGHGIHQFDLLVALLGPWAEVTAMAGRLARDTQTEDVSMALVRFENGAMATVMNSLLSPRETSDLRIDTERATVEVSHLYGYEDRDWTLTPAPGHEDVRDLWAPTDGGERSDHRFQMGAVLEALDRGEPLPVSLREARVTMELVASIYASAFTGQVVQRGEIGPGHPFYTRMDGTGAPWAGTVAGEEPR
jgi:predicted dehydrogenase